MYVHYSPLTELLLPYYLGIVYFFIATWVLSEMSAASVGRSTIALADPNPAPVEVKPPASSIERSPKEEAVAESKRSPAPAPVKTATRSAKTLAGALKQEFQQPIETAATANQRM